MALEFLYRDATNPARVALFPGSWNPPTVAHAAIASAALTWANEVIWILPAAFPHKTYDQATFADRGRMIELIARANPGFSAAISQGGLYSEMAREASGLAPELALVLGRDAAERIAAWDYGPENPNAFLDLLRDHRLLVAARAGDYDPPPDHSHRIIQLPFQPHDDVSSTEVRRRIAAHEPWQNFVPDSIIEEVSRIYVNS